jgi:hypothetical protein
MAVLSAQQITPTGTAVTYAAASAGGDRVPVGPNNFVHVKNGGGSTITVTINSIRACSYGFDHDLAPTIAAGADKMIGPITDRFQDVDGLAGIAYSAVTSVTVAAVTH